MCIMSTSSFLSISVKLLYASLLLSPYFSSPVVDGITLGSPNNTNIMCIEHEREALLKFKHGIHVDHCGLLSSWGDHPNCCQWHGVRCNNVTGHVIMLNLTGVDSMMGFCLEGELGSSVGELKHLKYLDLSGNFFEGEIPSQLGNLSNLVSLDLSFNNLGLYVKTLSWLSHLTMLKNVDLTAVNFSQATNWLEVVNNLPFLRVLHLEECSLPPIVPRQLSYQNSSITLSFLDLSDNNFSDSSIIFGWLLNLSGTNTHLTHLDLSFNQLKGPIPSAFGNLHALSYLDLSKNNFQSLPKTLGGLYSLQELHLNDNNFTDKIWGSLDPNLIRTFSSSLKVLNLRDNRLSGRIPQSLGQLSTLEMLDLSSNNLKGNISSIHFSNLSRLKELLLGDNSGLALHINVNWVPPFQLDRIDLPSCRLGPLFPKWLLSQRNYLYLDISNAGIYDMIPNSFWNTSPSKIYTLNLSHNKLYGTIPNFNKLQLDHDSAFVKVDLSFNNLEGVIPPFPSNISSLVLNNNLFSNPIPFLCPKFKSHLSYLDLSNNILSTKLPNCWMSFPSLQILHLENNQLYGLIPPSISHLKYLESLHLRNNVICGPLPTTSLEKLTSLVILDLGLNMLSGHIPSLLGTFFKNLAILSLRGNNLNGEIPLSLCQMSFLQILDLSSNHITGKIPKCIYNFTSMQNSTNTLPMLEYRGFFNAFNGAEDGYFLYSDAETIFWKRKEWNFNNFLGLVKAIDISNNELEGEIPTEFSFLKGLNSLNLSRNNLIGAVSPKLGQLTSLEILDLSRNHLSSEIPTSFAELNFLDNLDLSNNQLFGEIPDIPQLQSFEASAYMGNPRLCGLPLPNCPWDQSHDKKPMKEDEANHHKDEIDIFKVGLYVSVILGFIIGFWGVCGTLVVKRSWRHAFFQFLDDMRDMFSIKFFSNLARFRRRQ